MPAPHLTVWYNTRCPVCNGGIGWQRNKLLSLVHAGEITFKDINEQPDALAHFGAPLDDVRRRLHATDENGNLIVGADVAITIWLKRRARAGSQLCSAIASRCRSRAFSMTVLLISCLPGTGGTSAGEAETL